MPAIDPTTAHWVEVATGQPIVGSVALPGGMSSVVHRCGLADGRDVVVKHIRDAGWLQRDPDLIAREVRALDLVTTTDLPAPRHLASDPPRGLLLVSALPGRMRVDADGLRDGAATIATLAARIAAVSLPDRHGLPAWGSWAPDELAPPHWGDTALWQEGLDAFRAAAPPTVDSPMLLHRDLHPLNLLWDGDTIVGIVDWLNACVGHPHAELSHCRWNLAVAADLGAADHFLAQYLYVTASAPYSAWWDLSTLLGLLPGPIGAWGYHAVGRTDLTDEAVIARTERFLRAALDRLRNPFVPDGPGG